LESPPRVDARRGESVLFELLCARSESLGLYPTPSTPRTPRRVKILWIPRIKFRKLFGNFLATRNSEDFVIILDWVFLLRGRFKTKTWLFWYFSLL